VIYYVIPCRKNSKGVQHKNRLLWDYTASIIPEELYSRVIVTSDDEYLLDKAKALGMGVIERSEVLSADDAPIKSVMVDVGLKAEDDIVMLYLTYPDRSWADVEACIEFYRGSKSLLCERPLEVSPYLCLYRLSGNRGKQVIDHDKYRRQDYLECFGLCHYVAIFNVGELANLNNNLHNDDTVYYPLGRNPVDIDTKEDLDRLTSPHAENIQGI